MTCNKIINYVDEDKNTNLHYASARGDLDLVKKEIECNHEIDSVNYLGWTPLMMATRYGHTDVIKYLLERHADSTRMNSFGFNILLMAVACGKLDVIYIILQHLLCGGISKQSMQSVFSPISLAILFNNVNLVQYLIDKNFCVNSAAPITELTPMMFASAMSNTDIINMLRAKGAKEVENNYHPQEPPKPIHNFINVPHPLILVNSNHLSPQPTIICMQPNGPITRCSDLGSPPFTPNISPITPGVAHHQVFFPPNFSPNQYMNPYNVFPVYNSNDFLNVRMMPHTPQI
ncbi:hypothetical protein RN001_008215 [Aquatica leii]|uniref:Uncharacterized protein n=1 Tax=Aquatica leii TaxID=1421715 RepID=A0AAN7PX75_9COLE|nr:hypothetical protein RN001_008214 [Aquatica leii]KAK4880069.1 hypothetical protein RN001_008215 [Aquatica leii]